MIGGEFDTLQVALATAASSLESDVQRSTRALGLLAENLTDIAQTIIERTKERQARA
jgi:hypothetical protein